MLEKKATIEVIQEHYSNVCQALRNFEKEVEFTLQAYAQAAGRGEDPVVRINGEVFRLERTIHLLMELHFGVPESINKIIERPQESDAVAIKDFFKWMHGFFDDFKVKYQPVPEEILVWLNKEE